MFCNNSSFSSKKKAKTQGKVVIIYSYNINVSTSHILFHNLMVKIVVKQGKQMYDFQIKELKKDQMFDAIRPSTILSTECSSVLCRYGKIHTLFLVLHYSTDFQGFSDGSP